MAYLWRPVEKEISESIDDDRAKPLQREATKPGNAVFNLIDAHSEPASSLDIGHQRLQLPLAQTVFSTGLVSTCIRRHYRKNQDAAAGKSLQETLIQTKEDKLESYRIDVPIALPQGSTVASVKFATPLLPLTPLRRVENSMGNIVRKLSFVTARQLNMLESTGERSGVMREQAEAEPLPASSELEAMVTKYFEHLSIPPETVNVWALVIPKPLADLLATGRGVTRTGKRLRALTPENITSCWPGGKDSRGDDKHNSERWSRVLQLVQKGAKLCKVLSGGGGWGKKAGLLSLDPDVEYSTRELRQDSGWEFDFEDDSEQGVAKQQRQALGEVVGEGDGIMFFLSPNDEHMPEVHKASHLQIDHGIGNPERRVDFGTIPSTMDEIPDSQESEDGQPLAYRIHHYHNFFGAMSEGGMAMSFKRIGDRTAARLQDATTSPAAALDLRAQSKFDVPNTRFSMIIGGDKAVPSTATNASEHASLRTNEGDLRPRSNRRIHQSRRTDHGPRIRRVEHEKAPPLPKKRNPQSSQNRPIENQNLFRTHTMSSGVAKHSLFSGLPSPGSRRSVSTSTRLAKRPPIGEGRMFIEEQRRNWTARLEAAASAGRGTGAGALQYQRLQVSHSSERAKSANEEAKTKERQSEMPRKVGTPQMERNLVRKFHAKAIPRKPGFVDNLDLREESNKKHNAKREQVSSDSGQGPHTSRCAQGRTKEGPLVASKEPSRPNGMPSRDELCNGRDESTIGERPTRGTAKQVRVNGDPDLDEFEAFTKPQRRASA
ncbi:hypothetical protein MBLNU230_g7094t1 [Neophaeotheca triangularis]